LEHIVFFEALGQRSDLRLPEIPARLKWVVIDLVDAQLQYAASYVRRIVGTRVDVLDGRLLSWHTAVCGV
jgi:hypothetical protein